jgi:hypothetical protein
MQMTKMQEMMMILFAQIHPLLLSLFENAGRAVPSLPSSFLRLPIHIRDDELRSITDESVKRSG